MSNWALWIMVFLFAVFACEALWKDVKMSKTAIDVFVSFVLFWIYGLVIAFAVIALIRLT